MAHSPQHSPPSPQAIALGYQPEAIRARGLLVFLILFCIAMAALAWFVWIIMRQMESRNQQADLARSILRIDQQPPPPNLQPSVGHNSTDAEDLAALRSREDAVFAKMGWTVDAKTHEVRIPKEIEQRVADEARAARGSAAAPPTTTGKETNSILPEPKGGQRP